MTFVPFITYRALATRVLVVAKTRVEGAWSAYCDAVPGMNHEDECDAVLRHGDKLSAAEARVFFPHEPFGDTPYAP